MSSDRQALGTTCRPGRRSLESNGLASLRRPRKETGARPGGSHPCLRASVRGARRVNPILSEHALEEQRLKEGGLSGWGRCGPPQPPTSALTPVTPNPTLTAPGQAGGLGAPTPRSACAPPADPAPRPLRPSQPRPPSTSASRVGGGPWAVAELLGPDNKLPPPHTSLPHLRLAARAHALQSSLPEFTPTDSEPHRQPC